MTIRLGFCGVGKWARKLAESFRACGAEVVAHCRSKGANEYPGEYADVPGGYELPGFGRAMHWSDQIQDKRIDAIVAVAPPEITTQVALECARQGKAVMATKPLFDHPETIRAPFYVDFWRLWSIHHIAERTYQTTKPRSVRCELFGNGPFRSFPGAFDWGPHALAFALDLLGPLDIRGVRKVATSPQGGECFAVDCCSVGDPRHVGPGGVGMSQLVFGNATPEHRVPTRSFGGSLRGWSEDSDMVGDEPRQKVMERFCRAFLSDVSEGFVDTRLLSLSREGMRLLRDIRERAK